MKKIFVVLIAMMLVFPAFAQEEEEVESDSRVAITFDLTPTFFPALMGGAGVGVGLEVAVAKPISLKLNFLYVSFNWAMGASEESGGGGGGGYYDDEGYYHEGYYEESSSSSSSGVGYAFYYFNFGMRWYPDANYLDGFFLGLGLQYHHLLDAFGEFRGADTLGFYFGIGSKTLVGRSKAKFVVEPWLDFLWSIKSDVLDRTSGIEKWALGTFVGLQGFRGGLLLGIAF